MDKKDLKLISELQANGRISNQALADRVGVSSASCWRRIRNLEESGVIQGYSARLDRRMLDLNLCAFVHVSLLRHEQESTKSFEAAVIERPEVQECFATTGDADFILRVVTYSIETFDQFLSDLMSQLPQISHVRSNVALRELKLDNTLPLEIVPAG